MQVCQVCTLCTFTEEGSDFSTSSCFDTFTQMALRTDQLAEVSPVDFDHLPSESQTGHVVLEVEFHARERGRRPRQTQRVTVHQAGRRRGRGRRGRILTHNTLYWYYTHDILTMIFLPTRARPAQQKKSGFSQLNLHIENLNLHVKLHVKSQANWIYMGKIWICMYKTECKKNKYTQNRTFSEEWGCVCMHLWVGLAGGWGACVEDVCSTQTTAGRSWSRFPPPSLWPRPSREDRTAGGGAPDGPVPTRPRHSSTSAYVCAYVQCWAVAELRVEPAFVTNTEAHPRPQTCECVYLTV